MGKWLMVGGADLQLFFAFEVIERHSGCKSWWLNSPKLHLSLQIDSYCINNLLGFYNAAGFGGAELTLRHKDICFGYYAFSQGQAHSLVSLRDPVSSMEQLYWANLCKGFALGFGCGGFRLSLKGCSNFMRSPFFPHCSEIQEVQK